MPRYDYLPEYEEEISEGYEDQLFECGMTPWGCELAGTEYCDFECRVRDDFEADEEEA